MPEVVQAPAPVPEVVQAPAPDVYAVVTTTYLRAEPNGDLNYRVAMEGSRVSVNKIDGVWALVYGVNESDGIIGWVPRALLKKEE